MADILIRGVEMPEYCYECPCHNGESGYCQVYKSGYLYSIERPAKCPLLPLPEGHGRLIDADALFEKMYHLSDNEGAHKDSFVDDALILRDSACYLIEDAPTIVPAEGGGDDGV